MPTKISIKKQARTQKSAIKKLRDLGIIRADLRRKNPTPATKRALKKYRDVVEGRAAVLKVKNPKSYKRAAGVRVVGKNVIVPRRKGERISIDKKSGRIVHKRKIGKRTTTGQGVVVKNGQRPAKVERVAYAIPFAIGTSGNVEWFRFPTLEALHNFLTEYEKRHKRSYKNVDQYIVEEKLGATRDLYPEDEDEEERRNDKLDNLLEKRLTRKRTQRQAFIGEQAGY